ncbi:carbon-nitrogen hydrolase family protein [Virgisporangium aurantiacum]|uniref:Hydrolase n=1 Tax=Virgisporangium aurantiacum TaxID=175570 RepID=A0A8J4DYQ6_9ACTN|nr:carbon-nitrogen hydrolase family protein [Virgisporangium aurantiacum]GIJ55900.1 hydrolase [Virgisporangium aurantiacum]
MTLSLAVAQPPCVAFDVAANAVAHADAVRAADARVVVFPELSLTGYELTAPVLDPFDDWLRPLVEACAETNTVALVGAPVEGPHIAMISVAGDAVRVIYKKLYPGGAEPARFRAGGGPAVHEVDGWRLGLAICRDAGVPEHAAATLALGADVYVVGSAKQPDEAAVQDERAHRVATTYGVWVAVASFAGPTGSGEYDPAAGRSGIWRPDGTVAAQAGSSVGETARAVLDRA